MYLVDSRDKEYRHGDQGPRSNFGLCQLRPGEVATPHVHRIMEENFYVLKGKLQVEINGVTTIVEEGQMFHIEPGEFHKVSNPTDEYNEYIIAFADGDKYLTE